MELGKFEDLVSVIVIPCLLLSSCLLLWRFHLFVEELCQKKWQRNYFLGILKDSFLDNFIYGTILILGSLSMYLFSDSLKPLQTMQKFGFVPYASSLVAQFYLLIPIFQAYRCISWENDNMRRMNGCDYGTGMAHSYFYGYLKLVLSPRIDGDKPGFQQKIENYIKEEKINPCNFPVHKLIILVPNSGFTFPTLKDDPKLKDIEPANTLEDLLQNRAGTYGRPYRMGAYRITVRDEKGKYHVWTTAEGPTPLLTLHEACEGSSAEAANLRKHKKEIISNFLKAIKRLVQDSNECRDSVEFLYYNDEDPNNRPDVVHILREYLLEKRRQIL